MQPRRPAARHTRAETNAGWPSGGGERPEIRQTQVSREDAVRRQGDGELDGAAAIEAIVNRNKRGEANTASVAASWSQVECAYTIHASGAAA
jgi:hypothetical protein